MEEHKCEHNDISYPKGLKWTKQRKCVYQVLEEATEPLSAVQIYNRIERDHEGSDYAVSTIYRILATFEEHGMVEKTTFHGRRYRSIRIEPRGTYPLCGLPGMS